MIDLIKSAAKHILIDFEDSRKVNHRLTKGEIREYAIFERFLRPYLPARYSISSGIIINATGEQSKQQDLVIYDEFYSPKLLDAESNKIFFVESVLSVLEVKSTLDKPAIDDIVKKSMSVWNLSREGNPSISLVPGVIIPGVAAPILCIGIGYESSIALDVMPAIIRNIRNQTTGAHALSILCVLNDKNGESGLVVNVDSNNLALTQLIPSESSRLSYLKFNSPGDTLLYLYLLIMEHLRSSGILSSGPNLLRYAQLSGFERPESFVPRSEAMEGSIEVSGKRIPVYSIEKYRQLSVKVMNGNATSEEILEWFLQLPQMPFYPGLLDPESRVYINRKPSELPPTKDVYQAIMRYQEGIADKNEEVIVKRFIDIIRSVHKENTKLFIGHFNNPQGENEKG